MRTSISVGRYSSRARFTAPVTLDYDKDVLPLTPKGNATERHICEAYSKKGDKAFFYHSNEGKEIVGIVEVVKEAYPDPSDKTGKFVCVDIKADKPLPKPVTMAAIKADKKFAAMALVKYSRLSVQPVSKSEYDIVVKLGDRSSKR